VEAMNVAAEILSIPRKPRNASTSGPTDQLPTIAEIRSISASLLCWAVKTVSR
jgi:hypothetical protein